MQKMPWCWMKTKTCLPQNLLQNPQHRAYIFESNEREENVYVDVGKMCVWSKRCMSVNKSVKGQNFLRSMTAIRACPELSLECQISVPLTHASVFPTGNSVRKPSRETVSGRHVQWDALRRTFFFFSYATEAVWESCCCWHMQRDSPLLLEARWHILCVSHASPNGCFTELSARPWCLRCASHSIFKKPVLHTETADKYVSDE